MRIRRYVLMLAGFACLAGLSIAAFLTRDHWMGWLTTESVDAKVEVGQPLPADEPRMLKLTRQARKNLGLTSKQITLQSYWRTIQVPGVVVDRPGFSDRNVTASAVGIVAKVYAFPGDTVRAGDRLFTLRLISEYLQNAQTELFKTNREMQLVQEQKKTITDAGLERVNPARVLELDNQLRRLSAVAQAYRQDLLARGLSPGHIDSAANGKFVSEIEVVAPERFPEDRQLISQSLASVSGAASEATTLAYEVQELKVDLGQQVQAGQTLCLLANHQSLYIEGRGFKREAPLLEQAAQNSWPVRVEFSEDDASHWSPLTQAFAIRHLANTIDPTSRTFAFFLPLSNQSRAYEKDGKTFLVWRFRPGQRVRLHVPVEEFGKKDGKDEEKVIVLPAAAVAREGPEAYVFRQNGDLFERRPVQVLYEDRLNVVLANDGGISPTLDYLAQSAAASLNRILKAQNSSGGLPPGAHFHADGSLHIPGQ